MWSGPASTLLSSIFIPPVPRLRQFSATVPSIGLRATVIGSRAGLRAVHRHSRCLACSVAGAVIIGVPLVNSTLNTDPFHLILGCSPITSRSASFTMST